MTFSKFIVRKTDILKQYDAVQKSANTKHKLKFFALYSVCFCITAALSFFWFYAEGRSLLWSLDGLPVLFPSYIHQNELPSESLFDFTLGWGSDGYGFFSCWYFEPFQFVALLLLNNPGIVAYSVITVFKMYCAGAAFYLFAISEECDCFSSCIASLLYSFSVYSLYIGIRFPTFLVAMIYLPLMMVGLNTIVKQGKFSLLFSIMVMLGAISSVYFIYINTIFCALYAIIYLVNSKQTSFFDACKRLILCAVCGIGGAELQHLC